MAGVRFGDDLSGRCSTRAAPPLSRGSTTASAVSSLPPGLGGLIESATVSSDLTVGAALRVERFKGEQSVAGAERLVRRLRPILRGDRPSPHQSRCRRPGPSLCFPARRDRR